MSTPHKPDPALDAALLALARGAASKDDEAWVKRVASRAGPFAGTPLLSRTELDALLAPPADDDADVGGDFDPRGHAGDDHAAHAADHAYGSGLGGGGGWDDASLGRGDSTAGDAGAPLRVSQTSVKRESVHMEESMSEEEAPKKNDLGALAGLTRSSLAAPAPALGEIDGAAKGEDSGRIDLRAMLGPSAGDESNDDGVAAATASAVGKPDDNVIDIGAIQRASAPPKSTPKADSKAADSKPAASTGATVVSTAAAASAPAVAAKPAEKKGGMVWIGVALAAAAAVGVGVITLSGKKSEETASNKASAPVAAADKKDEKAAPVASASATTAPAATVAMADPAASAAASAGAPTPAPTGADPKGDPKMAANNAGTGAPAPGAGTAAAKVAPTASASAKPTPTNDPIHKPSGGSLDDVLGIGKEDPSKKPVLTADSNLPEKPDTGDIRSAVLGKQGAAQACVKGLDGDSSVAVTFGPAGNVTAVVVTSGPAKGTGAEACIKNAFNGAKVPASKKGGTGYAKLLP